ncbi:hypothetical protein RhiirA4_442823 [Rhizophagus irregularis]|uniref:Uncharacterized protein n=1 Tax=Rhizophagus irregularis TaxID=588596 RepID=A0A2I1GB77_9GLOM|nr:hypothetical protein RhiirA4_442823 [Rhizophagus irregularis]
MYLLIQLLNFIVELKDLKWKYGKPPVIVYNNVSCLVHKNPEFLTFSRMMQNTVLITKNIKKEIVDKFITAKLLQNFQNYKHYEMRKRIISKELDRTTFERFFDEPEEANEVLETNVFAYHPEKDT